MPVRSPGAMTGAGEKKVQSSSVAARRGRGRGRRRPEVASARYSAGKPSVSSRRVPSGASSEPAPPTKSDAGAAGVVDEVLDGGQPRLVALAGAARAGRRDDDVVGGRGFRHGRRVGEVAGGGSRHRSGTLARRGGCRAVTWWPRETASGAMREPMMPLAPKRAIFTMVPSCGAVVGVAVECDSNYW